MYAAAAAVVSELVMTSRGRCDFIYEIVHVVSSPRFAKLLNYITGDEYKRLVVCKQKNGRQFANERTKRVLIYVTQNCEQPSTSTCKTHTFFFVTMYV